VNHPKEIVLKPFFATVTALLIGLPTLCNALTLECKVPKTNSGGGYITELYVFQYDEATGKALAVDGAIMYYHDAPIPVRVSDDSAKKLVLSWTLQITTGSGQQSKMQYRASYFKQTKEIIVRAVPGGGYSNNFEGRGKCKAI
jgi:hypothetical protein